MLIVYPIVWEQLCGILKVPKVLNGVPWRKREEFDPPTGIVSSSSPFNEGLSLKFFILDTWMDRGGDFIQREVFQALPEEKRS